MPRRASPPKAAASAVPALRVNDLLFLNEYFRNGQNGKQAYLTVHPGVKACSAEVGAVRVLGREQVQAEMARRVQAEGVTRASVQAWLYDIAQRAKSGDRLDTELKAVVEMAELAGLKVQKVEDVTERVADRQQVLDALRTRGLLPITTS